MKKVSLAVFAVLSGISTTAFAAEGDEYFIGGGLGMMLGQNKVAHVVSGNFIGAQPVAGDKSVEGGNSPLVASIHGGVLIDSVHRWSIGFSKSQLSEFESGDLGSFSSGYFEAVFGYDYLFPINDKLSMFAGASTSIMYKQLEHELNGETKDWNAGEMACGLQVGANYKMSPNWSVELVYKHSYHTAESNGYFADGKIWGLQNERLVCVCKV